MTHGSTQLSQFIRTAAAARADAVLTGDATDDWSDVIGVVHGGGGRARRSGAVLSGRPTNRCV